MNAHRKIYSLLFLVLPLFSCQNDLEIESPKFDVVDYQVQPVVEDGVASYAATFYFDEEADIISLYSGEFGSEYKYKDGRSEQRESFEFSFTSMCNFGSLNPKDQLSIMISTDYDSSLGRNGIYQATWLDVTNKFELAERITDSSQEGYNEYVHSGNVDLWNMLSGEKSYYIAFRYVTPDQTKYGQYATVRIKDWKLSSKVSQIGKQEEDVSWGLYEFGDLESSGRNSISNSMILFRGNINSKTDAETEVWAISKEFSTELDFGPGIATPIKGVGEPKLTSFTYSYDEPGEYEVSFLASNATIENSEVVYQTVSIHIAE